MSNFLCKEPTEYSPGALACAGPFCFDVMGMRKVFTAIPSPLNRIRPDGIENVLCEMASGQCPSLVAARTRIVGGDGVVDGINIGFALQDNVLSVSITIGRFLLKIARPRKDSFVINLRIQWQPQSGGYGGTPLVEIQQVLAALGVPVPGGLELCRVKPADPWTQMPGVVCFGLVGEATGTQFGFYTA